MFAYNAIVSGMHLYISYFVAEKKNSIDNFNAMSQHSLKHPTILKCIRLIL